MNKIKKETLDIICLACVYLICNGIPFSILIKNDNICVILNICLLIFFVFYYFRYLKKYNIEKPLFNKIEIKALTFIPFLLLAFSNFFFVLIDKSNYIGNIDVFNLLLNLIRCILVATSEELVFRGVILPYIKKTNNNLKTMIYSSLVFGLVHILNISSIASILPSLAQVCYSFVLGLIVSFIYIYSNNLALSIIVHFMFNFFNSYLITCLFDFEWNLTFFIVNIIVGIIVLLYGFILYVLFNRKKEITYVS